jgi:hypothetical protein
VVQGRLQPKRVVGQNHLSQVAVRAAIGAIGSSYCTGQVIPRSYDEKIGHAPRIILVFRAMVSLVGFLPPVVYIPKLKIPKKNPLPISRSEISVSLVKFYCNRSSLVAESLWFPSFSASD